MSPGVQSAFSHYFTEAADRINLKAHRLVVLTDMRRVLLVEYGDVDLFAVRLADGKPVGRWTPLCRVPAGAILLSSPDGPRHRLVGRPVPGTVLSYLPVDRLTGLSARHAVSDKEAGRIVRSLSPADFAIAVRQLVRGLEAGLVALASAQRAGLPPREFTPLVPGAITRAGPGRPVRSIDGVQWVRVSSGVVTPPEVGGRLTAGADVCVTERDWLVTVDQPAELLARSTADLLAEGSLWSRLITHWTRLMYWVDRRVERREGAELEALRARVRADAGTILTARRSFEAVVRDTKARVRLADVSADQPTLAAMRLVASHQGFTIRAPAAADGYGFRVSEVQRIATANAVRTRDVRLEGRWWRRDIGPMLGSPKGSGPVIALLPSGGRYMAAFPAENKVVPVSRQLAATLDNHATVLYRPLPASVTGVRALLRFGFSGARADLCRIAVTGALVAAIGLLVPVMTGKVLGIFVARAQRDLIVEGSLLVIAGAFVAAVISVVQNIAALRLESRSVATLQAAVWSRLLSLPATFFTRYSTGELGTTALGVTAVQEVLSSVTTTAALGLLTGLANLILVFFYDLRLALTALALVVISVSACALAGHREIRWQRRQYDNDRELSAKVFGLLIGLPKLRVAAAEDRAFAQWSRTFTHGRALAANGRRTQNAIAAFNAGFPLVCSTLIYFMVAGPLRGISVATFLSFNAAFGLLIAATLQFTGVAITALGVVPMLERLTPILVAEPEAEEGTADPGDLSGQITFSHVSFRYGDDGPLVLRDVSFAVEPGEFVAIVGPTGSGKSSILRLLLGFEAPASGSVLFDGQDLAQLRAAAVRRQCGVVLQNGSLLAGDIKTNIIGSTSHTIDDAWAAARMAGIDADIAALPMGMHTILSEGSTILSGGQRQRIMIARALVSRPRIILFDEATSALDNPTQTIVSESMRQLNATRVIIAHRLSSVAEADRIIVLDRGQIVQQGAFEDLLADEGGLFATLARQQLS